MGFLDWLFGAPTIEKVARDVTRALHERDAQGLQVDLPRREMTFRLHGGEMKLFLGNLLHEMQHCPRAQRPALLQRFLDGVLTPEIAIPSNYAEARPRLMPVVRRRADIGNMALSTHSASDDPARQLRPATKPLVGELVIALVCDRPTSMAYVNEHELPKWGVTLDQALDDALDNLRGLPEHGGWQSMGQGVWAGEWGDTYDSSRILLPDLIHRVGVRDPVVAVPFRNALMLTGAANEAGIALMAKVIEQHVEDNQRWLSFQLLRLEGKQWVAHAPLVAVDTWHLLNLRNEVGAYENQKELIDAIHERSGIDIWVASCQMLSRDDLGTLSYSTWSEQVDTLLPHSEFIVFKPQADDPEGLLLVGWAEARTVVGDLMVPTDDVPERFRVRSFPDAAQLARLRELAVDL